MRVLPDERLLEAIRCPICQGSMTLECSEHGKSASLRCEGQAKRHCFDLASSGYVNLMRPGHGDGGDSKEAVRARKEFLSLDYYSPAALALCDLVRYYADPEKGILIDAGCGEGYYTAYLAAKGFSVAGVDLSRPAVDSAAKRLGATGIKNGFFSVSSVYELPMADTSATAVVNVFAPCAEEEFLRVLRPGGILAVMYAGPEHLMGLKKALYETIYENDGRADLPKSMTLLKEERVKFEIEVEGNAAVQNLFAMTPYYWKTSREDGEKLKKLDSLTTTVDMIIAIYQKKEEESTDADHNHYSHVQ